MIGPRQIFRLGHMPRARMLSEIAAGLPRILESAEDLWAAAETLPQAHLRSRLILLQQAEEEAAKGLMLMDLVRCPSRYPKFRQRLAKQTYSHLPRLIYAESCHWKPATFGEVRRIVEEERKEFFLDGPSGVDFVFQNRLIERREEALYCDYVGYESGFQWKPAGGTSVLIATDFPMLSPGKPAALLLLRHLSQVGAFRQAGLKIVDQTWDMIELVDEIRWNVIEDLNLSTLRKLEHGKLFDWSENAHAVSAILKWPMPLYPLELKSIRVSMDELAAERDAHFEG